MAVNRLIGCPFKAGSICPMSAARWMQWISWKSLFVILCLARSATLKASISSPPVIELSTELNVFSDSVSDHPGAAPTRYFRYLSVDPSNSNFLYVGAVDFVYRLDASYISENFVKSTNLSKAAADFINDNYVNCLARGKDSVLSCQNHIRAIIRVKNNKLFICATGVDSPMVYYLNHSSLDVLSVEYKGGRARCPYDPNSNYTIVYVENGNPDNIATTYSGTVTDFSNSDSVIFRPTLVGHDFKEYRLLRTEQDSRWLNDPHFVGSFDVGDYVYFFFRELAVENLNCERIVFSRVARICKRDEGGGSLSMDYRWTTYVKTRLNCSVPGEMPFYFNEIYDVQYNKSEETFYGLFNTLQGGYWGSAVCSYTLESINRVLDQSPFKGQQNFEAGWFPVSEKDTPSPRPGQCTYNSLDLSTSSLSFIKSHPLLHETVVSSTGRPLWFTKDDLALTRLAVHDVGNFKIFYLASSRGLIHKVAHWLNDDDNQVDSVVVAILKPLRIINRPIWQMVVLTVSSTKSTFLYLSTDDTVIQLQVENCYRHTKCQTCARDPYCGWNAEQNACRPFKSGLIQKVKGVVEDICAKSCQPSTKQYTTAREVVQGVPVHLNCTAVCSPWSPSTTKVIWHFSDTSSARLIKNDNREYVVTQDLGLVILDIRAHHNGTFSCSINGHIVARHQLHVLPCRLGMDREETWRQEFVKWCNAFSAYTQEYNHWMCLKKQCLKEKCIPQKILDKCSYTSLPSATVRRPP